MTFVVDASMIAAWLLPDESDPIAEVVATRFVSEAAIAPAIWWFEIRNIFLIAERRRRVTAQETAEALALLTDLAVERPEDIDELSLLDRARIHRLTLYDPTYLELAKRLGLPLATLDRDLVASAKAEGVPLIGHEGI